MRTTVEIEDELAKELKMRATAAGTSFRRILNETLARAISVPASQQAEFELPCKRLGKPLIHPPGPHKYLAMAGDFEDMETVRKLELRK